VLFLAIVCIFGSSRGAHLMDRTFLSYYCHLRHLRHEYFRIHPRGRHVTTKTIHRRLPRGSVHYTALHFLCRINFVTVILEQSNDSAAQQKNEQTSRLISDIVLVITFLITIAAMFWIWREMQKVRPAVLRERRIAKKWVLPEW
jgi:hypothetical protein